MHQPQSASDLVAITTNDFDIIFDLRYATINNFTGEKLYNRPLCYLHRTAADTLHKAITLAKKQNYRFKIFDCYRPISVQRKLYAKYSDDGFISNPETGAVPHCRGIAVDLTLIDNHNNELEMGTEFDAFTPLSYHGNLEISAEAQRNRYIFMGIMLSAGFDFYRNEWWHYQLFKPREYPIIENFEI